MKWSSEFSSAIGLHCMKRIYSAEYEMEKYHKAPRWLVQMQAKHCWTGKGRRKTTIDVVAALSGACWCLPIIVEP
jgi:hypothetical protein